MDNVWIMVEPPQMIRAVNGRTNTVVWDRNVAERLNKEGVYFAPLLDNGVIVGRTGRQNSGRVYALNSENGHILWASEERVLGNIVANRGVTFYVTEQAVLRAVNSRTGEIIASLAFIPEIASDEAMDTHYAYNIAINDDIVLMYMGNSKQLFAFRFVR
jgi:outer membrane protein assembly factor BamB